MLSRCTYICQQSGDAILAEIGSFSQFVREAESFDEETENDVGVVICNRMDAGWAVQ